MLSSSCANKLYQYIPIRREELPKFLRYSGMMFFILFVYTIMRDMKDTLVITAAGSGAEVLTFLKSYFVLPSAFLFMLLYSKVVDVLNKYKAFFFFAALFSVFFLIFGLFLYPNQSFIHPSQDTVEQLKLSIPNLKWLFALYGHWSFGLFYIFSELWGNVMLSLLFWWYMNNNSSLDESKRFYPVMALLAQFALIFSGLLFRVVNLTFADSLALVVYIITGIILFCIAMTTWIYCASLKYDAPKNWASENEVAAKQTKKKKTSIFDGIKYLYTSEYLGYVCLVVICYGMAINLTEVTWKSFIREYLPSPTDYGAFMGLFSMINGISAFILMLIGSRLLRKYSWQYCALVTPVVLGIAGVIFFIIANFKGHGDLWAYLGYAPLAFLAWLGLSQVVFSKSVKYALFDPTKEMTYIPLSDDIKTKGKAAIDVVGSRLGKSGGSVAQNIMLIVTAGSQMTILPIVSVVFLLTIVLWVFSVRRINGKFVHYLKKDNTASSNAH